MKFLAIIQFGEWFGKLWDTMFKTRDAGGFNIGFWFSMIVVALVVVVQIVVFWTMKPKKGAQEIRDRNAGKIAKGDEEEEK